MNEKGQCPECGGGSLYRTLKPVGSGGGHAPNFLPGLGTFWKGARFGMVVCGDCGLTRFYAQAEARERLSGSKHWGRIG